VFGPRTESLVKSFQRGEGIVADGVVEATTWAALEGSRAHSAVLNRNRLTNVPNGNEAARALDFPCG